MSSDDTTTMLPTEDPMNQLLLLVQGIDARLRSLEEKVDARLHDTRPIWESVQAQLKEMSLRLEDIDTRLDKVEGTGLTTRSELRELRRDLKEHLPAMK
jgi:predicted  nucleic acid-binding Zn-ribbon protein